MGTLAVCFVGLQNLIDLDNLALIEGAGILAISKAAALAYMMFNLYTPLCFAAIGAMNAEMKSKKWLFAGIGLQLGIGYTVAFAVYQIGTLLTTGSVGAGFSGGLGGGWPPSARCWSGSACARAGTSRGTTRSGR